MKTIENVVKNYFEAYLNADSEDLLKAFHPETILYSVDNGKLKKTEMADWISNLNNRKQKGDIRAGKLEILSIDTQETSALAKIKIKLPNIEFVDYLSLLNYEGSWKIVGKIYTVSTKGLS